MESAKEEHARNAQLIGGYSAFVAALLIATIAKSESYPRAWIIISLLALSLPSLVALPLIDFIVRVRQARKVSATRAMAANLGFLPSLAAIAMIVGHFSVIAGILFILLCGFWTLTIYRVAVVGHRDRESDV